MKKIFALFLTVATVGAIFTSCKKDEPVGPTISYDTNIGVTANTTVDPGDTVDVGVIMTAGDADLSELKVTVSYDGALAQEYATESQSGTSGKYDTKIATRSTEGTETYTFTVTDKDGLTGELKLTITTESSSVAYTTFADKDLGNQNHATKGSFFATADGSISLTAAANSAPATIDFAHYYGATNMATIAAPDNSQAQTIFTSMSGWATQNATKFKTSTMTKAEFDAIADGSEINAAYSASTATEASHATQLAADDVVAFSTAAGKKGLILVKSISGDNSTSGSMVITVKIVD